MARTPLENKASQPYRAPNAQLPPGSQDRGRFFAFIEPIINHMKQHGHQQALLIISGMVLGAVAAGVIVGNAVIASTYIPPTANPPEGNIPSTVWNRLDISGPQQGAAIQIDGGGPAEDGGVKTDIPVGLSVGASFLDLGPIYGGENVYYGVADYNKMKAEPGVGYDYLMLLQTYDDLLTSWNNRFSVDKDGNVEISGDLVTEGQLKSTGCFGPKFVGFTVGEYSGNLGGINMGYDAANDICAFDYGPDAHVCSSAEILNSIKCSKASSPDKIRDPSLDGLGAWINAGPPGYTASSND
ncbi:MAG: hypothetical protein KAT58_10475, partial [candidate division Zixibacteria bacterium]|nr:hypothetical protein [candidate division Zixibacteria bacterium]